jgi:3-oxoadipate enol-lactonase
MLSSIHHPDAASQFQGKKLTTKTVKSARMPIDCPSHSPCFDLAYTEGGTGEALILIHGLGANAWSWRQQLEELSQAYRVVALDLRGHGNSGHRPEEAITIRAFADDIIALGKGLGLERAHVCGNSLGGMIALEIWVRCPSLMKSLILADTTAFFPPPHMLEEFLRLFDQMDMAAWAQFMAPRLLRQGAPAGLQEEVVQMITATNRAVYRQGLAAVFLADYRWTLPTIDIPTLILVGQEDQATPVGYARYLESQIRDAKLQVVPKAAHLPHRENPGEFNQQLQEHLERCENK